MWGKAAKRRITARYITTTVNCFRRLSRRVFGLHLSMEFSVVMSDGMFSGPECLRLTRRRNSTFNSNKMAIKLTVRNIEFLARLILRKTISLIPVMNFKLMKHTRYNKFSKIRITAFLFVTIFLKPCGCFMAIYWDQDKAKMTRKEKLIATVDINHPALKSVSKTLLTASSSWK